MRVFVIAGEPSGDRLGAALMAGLKTLRPVVAFEGIGGPAMTAEGLSSRFDMRELSVMGIAEVLPKYRHLKRRIAETADVVIRSAPDVLITIDSPDFCLRVARLVKATSPQQRIVHYVAPSVWAWRPGRAAKMAACVDQVLALLPFEPPLMQAAGVACDFVGHPVVAEPEAGPDDIAAFRARAGLGDAPVTLVLPGSRQSEISRLAPVFGAALKLDRAQADARVVVPSAPGMSGLVRAAVAGWPGDPVVVEPRDALDKSAVFRSAGLALAASGTVSLELAAARVPMVIGYRFNWLTWQIMSRMALIDTVTLVNLVSDTRAVPECLGPDCTAQNLSSAMMQVRAAPAAQFDAMERTMALLGRGGEAPGLRAARAVLERL